MKGAAMFALRALFTGCALASNVHAKTGDKTITKVVKLLQDMLDKSVAEGDAEVKTFAKFKCYCDQNDAEKTEAIEHNTDMISILESKVAELQGSNGERSSQSAQLKADMADNKAAQSEAEAIRKKANKAFNDDKSDLTQAIGQMKQAIETLAEVGADQTKSTGADNAQFMAKGASMLSLESTMHKALSAAEAFMNEKQYNHFTSFLQGPFTGTYTSQSGAVMGMIKSMRDTFKANLETAITTEDDELKAHGEFMDVKKEAYKQMEDLYQEAQGHLGNNDNELSSKRKQLSEAEKAKTEAEDFLDKLRPMCVDKTEDYEHRKMMRANEEAAIAKAVSILNSDDAFATFGASAATSSGATSFLQVSRHEPSDDVRTVVQRLLARAASERQAPRLAPVVKLLQVGNPFDEVLAEIDKMIDVIDEEGVADKEKLDWCNKERKESNADLKSKKGDILRLEGAIDKLEKTIEDPKTGLKKQISETETSLLENDASQKTETTQRFEENKEYQANVKNLGAAKGLLTNAIKVLNAYYDLIDKSFLQANGMADPDPPATFEGNYKGQSEKGGDVIDMLDFILKESEQEETDAHASEEKSQADFEDSMQALKDEQAKQEKSLADLQDTLAEKEQDLLTAQEDLKVTTKDKESVEDNLASIKPGCDFITSNFKESNANRKIEKNSLNKAMGLLENSPAYKNAEADTTVESYGDCKSCIEDTAHVECKACMAKVTEPAYCAGHKGTKGC